MPRKKKRDHASKAPRKRTSARKSALSSHVAPAHAAAALPEQELTPPSAASVTTPEPVQTVATSPVETRETREEAPRPASSLVVRAGKSLTGGVREVFARAKAELKKLLERSRRHAPAHS